MKPLLLNKKHRNFELGIALILSVVTNLASTNELSDFYFRNKKLYILF